MLCMTSNSVSLRGFPRRYGTDGLHCNGLYSATVLVLITSGQT